MAPKFDLQTSWVWGLADLRLVDGNDPVTHLPPTYLGKWLVQYYTPVFIRVCVATHTFSVELVTIITIKRKFQTTSGVFICQAYKFPWT